MSSVIPVITLDGPSGVGKGTIGLKLAHHLKWHFLDSGALYRILAWEAHQQNISLDQVTTLAALATELQPTFQILPENLSLIIKLRDQNITDAIRTEAYATHASRLAVYPQIRQALLACQHHFRQAPGLVADGRDMGSVVFPDANHKFFLTASHDARAQRRYLQLKQRGNHASLSKLKTAILQRDTRDRSRPVAALKAAPDALSIDTTTLSIDEVFLTIMQLVSNVSKYAMN